MWETDLVLMLRLLINDLNTPQKHTDAYLEQVIVLSSILADQEVDFAQTYLYDMSAVTISPDPIVSQDTMFQALVPLKAACVLNQGDFQKAIGQGIKVRDGDSSVDTTASFGGYKDILNLGPCASYEKLKKQILVADGAGYYGAVISPFRGVNDSPIDTLTWYYDQVSNAMIERNPNRRW